MDNGAYTKSKSVENLLTKSLPPSWVIIDDEGPDLALNNKFTNSFFLFNSACRRHEASDLNILSNSILAGINDVEYLHKEKVFHQDREASLSVARGSMDGIQRYFRILTTQKNNCIYDYALISTNLTNLNQDTEDFTKFTLLLKLN